MGNGLHPLRGIDWPYITCFSSSQCHYLSKPFHTTSSYLREHRLLPYTHICSQRIEVYLFRRDSAVCLLKHVCFCFSKVVQLLTSPFLHYSSSLHPFHFLQFQLADFEWELVGSYEQPQDNRCLSDRDAGWLLESFNPTFPDLLPFILHCCQSWILVHLNRTHSQTIERLRDLTWWSIFHFLKTSCFSLALYCCYYLVSIYSVIHHCS